MARTDVAAKTLLSKPAVSGIIEELIAEGLVVETGVGESTVAGGRPKTLLDFDVTTEGYLGIHIGVDHTTVVVTDGRTDTLASRSCVSTIGAPKESVEQVQRLARAALKSAGMPKQRIRRAAVTLPGLVDRTSGICTIAPNLGWRNFPITQSISEALSVTADGYNITQAAAFAEARVGVATGVKTFVWLYVGSGVGSAIMHEGQLVYGTRGFSGEIGHCRITDDPKRCHCGKKGCLEVFTSGPAIAKSARRSNISEVIDAAQRGDKRSLTALRDAGHLLGRGASYLVNILNPELVVVGGEVSVAADLLLNPLRDSLHQDALESDRIPVVASSVSGDSALAGAVLLAFDAAEHAESQVVASQTLTTA
jgi:predicted NBD/HSP70 family sugar kinase